MGNPHQDTQRKMSSARGHDHGDHGAWIPARLPIQFGKRFIFSISLGWSFNTCGTLVGFRAPRFASCNCDSTRHCAEELQLSISLGSSFQPNLTLQHEFRGTKSGMIVFPEGGGAGEPKGEPALPLGASGS